MEKIVSRVELSDDPALPGEILNKAESLYVAFQTGDFPYVLPFNHVWLDGHITSIARWKGARSTCCAGMAGWAFPRRWTCASSAKSPPPTSAAFAVPAG